MSTVRCEIREELLLGPIGPFVRGIVARCSYCENETMSAGTSEKSVRRCLALMRETCPTGEKNFYVTDDD